MKQILLQVLAGETLSQSQMRNIMVGITQQHYNDIHIAALLTAIQQRGVTVDEILGLRQGLLETGLTLDLSTFDPIDIVGTGGDGKNTFNISTCAAFLVAGAGYKVAKHGNYSATSVSGASNVLQEHGVCFTVNTGRLRQSIEESGVAYLHAPLFAYGMKWVAPVRKALQTPTAFNLLGPLVNPAQPRHQLLGTADLSLLRLYKNVLERLNINYGIVTSVDGYDEISLTSCFKIITQSQERVCEAADLGLPMATPQELFGGSTLAEARAIFDSVLEGTSTAAQRNAVVANAAAAIHILQPKHSLTDCVAIAQESLNSGRALRAFRRFVDINS